MDLSYKLCILTLSAATAGTALYFSKKQRGLPLPPGPRASAIPFIGNMFEIPREREWLRFAELGREFGPLVMLTILGKRICIINSVDVALDLLASRGYNYSERPDMVMVKELMGWSFNFGLRSASDPTWEPSRKRIVRAFSWKSSEEYLQLQTRESTHYLASMLDSPELYEEHLKLAIAAVIMAVTFGYRPDSTLDPFVCAAEAAQLAMSRAARPGAYLVDTLPFLKYVPAWVPGAGAFQRVASESRQLVDKLLNGAWSWAMAEYTLGTVRPSLFRTLVEQHTAGESDQSLRSIQEDCALMYATAVDTTVGAILTFTLAMLHAPEVQVRARAEIDRVTGASRLPTFEDRGELPFIGAIAKEVLRWEQVAPLGVPHVSLRDDVYKGYQIPAGTTMIPNQWAMSHDPSVYADPMSFKPERFLLGDQGQVRHPNTIAFGWGKRICPGRHLAQNSLWLHIATTLACFEIHCAKDADGNEIVPPRVFTSGLSSRPEPFPVEFVLRTGWDIVIRETVAHV